VDVYTTSVHPFLFPLIEASVLVKITKTDDET